MLFMVVSHLMRLSEEKVANAFKEESPISKTYVDTFLIEVLNIKYDKRMIN